MEDGTACAFGWVEDGAAVGVAVTGRLLYHAFSDSEFGHGDVSVGVDNP